jgi:hypothetical protein
MNDLETRRIWSQHDPQRKRLLEPGEKGRSPNQMASRMSRGEFNEDFGQGFQEEFVIGYCFAQQALTFF